MLVWQSGADVVALGTIAEHECVACGKFSSSDVLMFYTYWGMYWIFNIVTRKRYLAVCRLCRREQAFEPAKTEARHGVRSIPFMRRFGLVLLVSLWVGLLVTAVVVNNP